MVKEIALGLIAMLLLEPLETNYHAKNDVSSPTTLTYRLPVQDS